MIISPTPYSAMKDLKKQEGITKINDLLVLAPQNDPFYMGQPAQLNNARWFAEVWHNLGFDDGDTHHIRRVHYRIVSQPVAIVMPGGESYQNTKECYAFLNSASKQARYLIGEISPSNFVDRRNSPAVINDEDETEVPMPMVVNRHFGSLPIEISMPGFAKVSDFNDNLYGSIADPYMVEVWCEKSTMNDIIIPLSQELSFNYVYGLGELSLTLVDELVDRVIEREKPTRIFYISDFDPAGLAMPVSISRKIEFLATDKYIDVKLFPLMLTEQQCIDYALPRTPIKESDLRKRRFENNYGAGATELDALEALHPGVFGDMLREAVMNYRSSSYTDKVMKERRKYDELIENANESVYEKYADEIEESKVEWRAIQELADAWKAEYETLYSDIDNEIDGIELEEFTLPDLPTFSDHTAPLFSTDRDYIEQLSVYKKYQR